MRVFIDNSDYEIAKDASENMWCSGKSGRYGRGILNTKDDKFRTERSGRLGEVALGKVLGLEIDSMYRHGGDNFDFKVGCLSIDIKTSVKKQTSQNRIRRSYVRYMDGRRGRLNLKCDLYVAAEVDDDTETQTAVVDIFGYMSRSGLKDLPTAPGIYGYEKGVSGWRNYLLMENRLYDIQELIDIKEILC